MANYGPIDLLAVNVSGQAKCFHLDVYEARQPQLESVFFTPSDHRDGSFLFPLRSVVCEPGQSVTIASNPINIDLSACFLYVPPIMRVYPIGNGRRGLGFQIERFRQGEKSLLVRGGLV